MSKFNKIILIARGIPYNLNNFVKILQNSINVRQSPYLNTIFGKFITITNIGGKIPIYLVIWVKFNKNSTTVREAPYLDTILWKINKKWQDRWGGPILQPRNLERPYFVLAGLFLNPQPCLRGSDQPNPREPILSFLFSIFILLSWEQGS